MYNIDAKLDQIALDMAIIIVSDYSKKISIDEAHDGERLSYFFHSDAESELTFTEVEGKETATLNLGSSLYEKFFEGYALEILTELIYEEPHKSVWIDEAGSAYLQLYGMKEKVSIDISEYVDLKEFFSFLRQKRDERIQSTKN